MHYKRCASAKVVFEREKGLRKEMLPITQQEFMALLHTAHGDFSFYSCLFIGAVPRRFSIVRGIGTLVTSEVYDSCAKQKIDWKKCLHAWYGPPFIIRTGIANVVRAKLRTCSICGAIEGPSDADGARVSAPLV